MINFPDYEYFNNADIAYSDFIQTPVISSFKEIRITISTTGLMVKFQIRLFSGINVLRKLRPLDLILMNRCIKKEKKIYENLLKTKKRLLPRKIKGKRW